MGQSSTCTSSPAGSQLRGGTGSAPAGGGLPAGGAPETVDVAELIARVRASSGLKLDERTALAFLRFWQRQGVVAEAEPGRWKLTDRGRSRFGGWAVAIDEQEQAA